MQRRNTLIIHKKPAINLATFRAGILDVLIRDQVRDTLRAILHMMGRTATLIFIRRTITQVFFVQC